MDKNFDFTEKNLKDLQKTFQDPKILSTLLEYYEVVEKINNSEQDSTNTTTVTTTKTTDTDTDIGTNTTTIVQPQPPPKTIDTETITTTETTTKTTHTNTYKGSNTTTNNDTTIVQPLPSPKTTTDTDTDTTSKNDRTTVQPQPSPKTTIGSSTIKPVVKTKKVKSISGFCFKTHSNLSDKVYVMISHYPTIGTASLTEDKGWIIPYSLFEPEEQQHSFTSPIYKVYHIIFGTDTYNESTKTVTLNRLLIQTSMQAIYQKFKESLNIAAIKISKKQFPKQFHVTIVDEPIDNNNIQYKEPPLKEQFNNETGYYQPIFTIQNIGIDNKQLDNPVIIPKFIEFNINLPKLNNINELILEIEDNEKLILREDNVKYNLEVLLKHNVEDEPIAKFNKVKKNLYLKLKVIEDSHSHNHGNEDHQHNNKESLSIINELDKLGFGSSTITEPRDDLPTLNLLSIPNTIKYHTTTTTTKPHYIIKQNHTSIIFIIYEDTNLIDKNSISIADNLIKYKKKTPEEEIKILTNFILSEFSSNHTDIHFTDYSMVIELKKVKFGVWNEFI